jgi:hypothetical protein
MVPKRVDLEPFLTDYSKETRMRLRAMRDLTKEVKDLTRKLGGGVHSTKRKADGSR